MLWIVGRTYAALEAYLYQHSIAYGLLHDTALPQQQTRAQQTINANFSNETTLRHSLEPHDIQVSGFLLAGYEQYVEPLAVLQALFDIPGLSLAAARAARDKSLMRQAFKKYNPLITPSSQAVTSLQDALDYADAHGFPVVLKPTNLAKSKFVSINTTPPELIHNFAIAQASDSPLLVEDYLSGSMHTVAGFVDAAGTICLSDIITDCVMAKELGYNDSFIAERTIPSQLSAPDQQAVLEVARQGVIALGLQGVALHIELILTKEGPKLIEIGARLGGYRAVMYMAAANVDLYGGLVATALGKKPALKASKNTCCSVIELFPKIAGPLAGIRGVEALAAMPAVAKVTARTPLGRQVGPAYQGYRAAATITLVHAKRAEVQKTRDYIRSNVTVAVSEP